MGDTLNQNATANSFVRPQYFFITGFSNIPHAQYYFIFLCLVYVVTVLGNSCVTLIIYVDRSLHTPKYMAIFTLAVADLGESTAVLPNVINVCLLNIHQITYEACVSNMFFIYFFSSVQSVMLTVLAYDRFVAICFPLRYHSIVTNTTMGIILTVGCIFNVVFVMSAVLLVTRLSFCKSIVIDSYFCDHGPLYRMACNDNLPNYTMAKLFTILYFLLPLSLICLSYVCILLALFKIASWEGRLKALKTCFSHLILVSAYYFPILGIYIGAMAGSVHRNARIINISLSYAIPAMLNPIVYSLNTAEIKDFVKRSFRRKKYKNTVTGTNN
ncbi:olfactory receptor 1-like [Brienomyrus brachyistius]|uniref:olfactory receptor 1-like n=1 Tax=Brienomyrus brachyistius TaxID=42636 RepID=UPI0020B44522|nr:olfactory receptor 1-like [Brienomyrus brachyistius]XP_048837588.1 olfactory receptor 1-like [Brienomyrus brachyistius]XP_048837589.1 olfactory receptor 1-like [Brienomyrus brachyistius]XP_048837590.1 olfactory receptor 1-like [Brienomyrus brachyistius]XP_048837591.1 olfactory receptor 1-like [Brienomyrus brachyistius]XP_048837592.1 olfactory receptor 1-like [Brienomyrus brachyistius]XP_048837593.1 olfactory receptor 1-like [Brienomyrus brachyistius]XP_048837594.1 olfactory receptor 1-lik